MAPAQNASASRELLAKSGVLNLGGAISGRVLGFIFTFVLARLLGPSLLGSFWMAVGVFSILHGFTVNPSAMILLRFVAAYDAVGDSAKVRGTLIFTGTMCAVLSCLVVAGLYLTIPTISLSLFHNPELITVLRVMAWALPFAIFTNASLSAALGFKEYKPLVVVLNALDPAMRILLVAAFYAAGARLLCAPMAFACAWVANAAFALWLLVRIIPGAVRHGAASFETGKWLRFAGAMQWGALAASLLAWSDTLILGHYLTPVAVATYGVASRLVGLAAITQSAVTPMTGPLISSALSRSDFADVSNLLKAQCRWQTAVVLPFVLVLTAFGHEVLRLFGPGFVEAYSCLLLLTVAIILNSTLGSIGDLLNMSSHYAWNILNITVHFAATIGFSIVLVPRYGIFGAAMAYVAATFVARGLLFVEVWLLYKIHPFDRWTAHLILLCAACAGCLLFVTTKGAGRVIPLLAYAIVAWRIGILPEDLHTVRLLLKDWLPAKEVVLEATD